MLNFGLGACIGGVATAIFVRMQEPTYGFGFGALVGCCITVAGALTDSELETNRFAQVKDYCLTQYETEWRRLVNPDGEPPKPSCCTLVGYKLRTLWEQAFGRQEICQFYLFLFTLSFLMPMFDDFLYYFAIEKLDITPEVISLMAVWVGAACIALPFIYNTCLRDTEFRIVYALSQFIYIIAYMLLVALVSGWTKGLPNELIYFLATSFVWPAEKGFFFMPSMIISAKLAPQGIESTIVSLSTTVMMLS